MKKKGLLKKGNQKFEDSNPHQIINNTVNVIPPSPETPVQVEQSSRYAFTKNTRLPVDFYLNASFTFFLFTITQLQESIKQYHSLSSDYKLFMIPCIIFFGLGVLMLGIYIGRKTADPK